MRDAKCVGVLVHVADEAVGQRADGLAILRGAANDLVIDVGDVLYIGHVVAGGAQPALHHVEYHHHARMADVAIVVHRHAADIHAYTAGFDWHERLLFTRERVVDIQRMHETR
ncbi:hypothetical protein OR16_35877 [Cupriavidus basilensis OR16]|uniref:Uncharacterized protein n=1 Tax=Cupriavidus basilensis OR16 TaxID=1127483 RepID=H1SFP6_9BURK|nr:hypothetical protein OR16_35877 [Cupriavidus basilensis OR16]